MGAGFRVCAAEASGVARRRVVAAGDGGTREPRWAARIRPQAPSAAALPPSTATGQMPRRNPCDVMSLALSAGAVPTSHFRRIRRASHCSIIPAGTMRHFCILGLITLVLSTWCGPAAHAELRGGGAPRIRVGGQEPVSPVPQRRRLPASRRRNTQRRGAGRRAAVGARDRWPRLGPRYGGAPVRRPRRQAAGSLRAGRRARGLSVAARSPRRRRACRNGARE